MFAEVVEIRDRLADLVDRLDPDAVSGSAARELWAVLDKSERLCAAGKTLLARRVAATHRRSGGTGSTAEELARTGGTSAGQARDAVDTSTRLPEQPPVEEALRRGELSAAQAALVSAAAAANPAQAERLTELASRVSLAELREECARVRAAADPDPEARNRRLHAQRRVRRWINGEGFWNLHAQGTPQDGAAFTAVLDALTDRQFRAARRDRRPEPVEAYAFDALMAMADQVAHPAPEHRQPGAAAAATPDPRPDGGPGTGPAASSGDRPVTRPDGAPFGTSGPAGGLAAPAPTAPVRSARTVNPRFLALLRVDVTALHRGRVEDGELCEIRGVGPVPVSVAEGLLGQAVLKLVITNGADVLNVTHLGRGPTAAQKVALAWASPGCTVEGCWRARTETDHREPWASTKHTRLDELDPLCAFHHDLKTRYGWALVAGTGKRAFVPPDDPRHPRHQAKPPAGRAGQRPTGRDTASTGPTTLGGPTPPTRPSTATRRRTRRRAAAAAQTTLPDPPGDPP